MNMEFEPCATCGSAPVADPEGPIRCPNEECETGVEIRAKVPLTAWTAWNCLMALAKDATEPTEKELETIRQRVDHRYQELLRWNPEKRHLQTLAYVQVLAELQSLIEAD